MRSFTFWVALLGLLATSWVMPSALAQPVAIPFQPTLSARDQIADYVSEASRRFGIPEAWIAAVMRVESAGDPTATSRAGAIGLMQVMPQTYATLRARLGLGVNAYDPHDNIMAGAAYLRELHDRYGDVGFLAAYNAGPGRWEDHLATVRPLPPETLRYVARLTPMLYMREGRTLTLAVAPLPIRPETAPIFVALGVRRAADRPLAISPGFVQVAAAEALTDAQPNGLFAPSRPAAAQQPNGGERAVGLPSSSWRPVAPALDQRPLMAATDSLFVLRTPSRQPQR